jgi:phenylacetate-coenzyme A ligase PaaK-like adenylate-forming protein
MKDADEIRPLIFRSHSPESFEELAIRIFRFQFETVAVYREFATRLGRVPGKVNRLAEIPFLPITFFRDHEVISGGKSPTGLVFSSSGTTGVLPGRHFVKDAAIYRESFHRGFSDFYGDPGRYRFLVLLPGYLERQGSSLVYMMEQLVGETSANGSGFFLRDFDELAARLRNPAEGLTDILFGASYALLDFAEIYPIRLQQAIVMETGGMKGRKREMVREELHGLLTEAFGVKVIHSEYGMTELLSQAYSRGNGLFHCPPWMKVLARDANDPLELLPAGKSGGLNVIDLANLHSCSFLATQDLCTVHAGGSFEVLGRFDDSDVRGCNLMVV